MTEGARSCLRQSRAMSDVVLLKSYPRGGVRWVGLFNNRWGRYPTVKSRMRRAGGQRRATGHDVLKCIPQG